MRATFHEEVRDQLGREICSGHFRSGQLLPPEAELCARFGYSRIVIREAIKSLVAKGMLGVSRRTGTVVQASTEWNLFDRDIIRWRASSHGIDPTMARDLMELRRIVEPAAVRLAAQRASERDRHALRAAYLAMERAVAGEGDYVTADLAFHAAILDAGGNQFVRQMEEAMSALLRTSFELISETPGGPASSLPMHEAVCLAIERGDPDAAHQAALVLIDRAETDLNTRLALAASRREAVA